MGNPDHGDGGPPLSPPPLPPPPLRPDHLPTVDRPPPWGLIARLWVVGTLASLAYALLVFPLWVKARNPPPPGLLYWIAHALPSELVLLGPPVMLMALQACVCCRRGWLEVRHAALFASVCAALPVAAFALVVHGPRSWVPQDAARSAALYAAIVLVGGLAGWLGCRLREPQGGHSAQMERNSSVER